MCGTIVTPKFTEFSFLRDGVDLSHYKSRETVLRRETSTSLFIFPVHNRQPALTGTHCVFCKTNVVCAAVERGLRQYFLLANSQTPIGLELTHGHAGNLSINSSVRTR